MARTHKKRNRYKRGFYTTQSSNKSGANKSGATLGGKVIGSGGFGCIFRPALKCKNKKALKNDNRSYITKLMKKKYAIKEHLEVLKFYKLLKNIPDFEDYFLLEGFSTCPPEKLSDDDLENFDEKCSALKKMGLNVDNINKSESLEQLLALNMPYGGTDVSKFIDEHWHNSDKMIELNNSLIKLLEKGIVPMNNTGVFHCDLKSSNILAREEGEGEGEGEDRILYTRLIDWGLSTSYTKGNPIPKVLTNRPFQYNVPFSNILFTSLFNKMYKSFLEKNRGTEPDYYTLRTFVINYVLDWVEERGPGHLKTMNNIFKNLFEHDLKNMEESFKGELIEYDFTFYFIFEYITKILTKFTKNGKFDSETYLSEVFLKNIDLWGFVVSYVPIVEDILNAHKKLTSVQMDVLKKIKGLMTVLIDASDKPIDVEELVSKLRDLNTAFAHFKRKKRKDTSSSLSSSSSTSSLPKKDMIDLLNTEEKRVLEAGSLSSATRKKLKKKHFHKMMVKTLKNIKSLHSKRAWL